jgi:hypothetical protein
MPAPPDIAKLRQAIRHAVWYLESGRADVARDLLRATVPCPPPEHARAQPLRLIRRTIVEEFSAPSAAPRRA